MTKENQPLQTRTLSNESVYQGTEDDFQRADELYEGGTVNLEQSLRMAGAKLVEDEVELETSKPRPATRSGRKADGTVDRRTLSTPQTIAQNAAEYESVPWNQR